MPEILARLPAGRAARAKAAALAALIATFLCSFVCAWATAPRAAPAAKGKQVPPGPPVSILVTLPSPAPPDPPSRSKPTVVTIKSGDAFESYLCDDARPETDRAQSFLHPDEWYLQLQGLVLEGCQGYANPNLWVPAFDDLGRIAFDAYCISRVGSGWCPWHEPAGWWAARILQEAQDERAAFLRRFRAAARRIRMGWGRPIGPEEAD